MTITNTTIAKARITALVSIDELRRAEAELELRVRNFLEGRNIPGLRRIGVEAVAGQVTLRGRVRTFYEKQLAIHCCQRVAGVIHVVDAIEVSRDASD
jgi:osmotically-inducible protein OsmY